MDFVYQLQTFTYLDSIRKGKHRSIGRRKSRKMYVLIKTMQADMQFRISSMNNFQTNGNKDHKNSLHLEYIKNMYSPPITSGHKSR